MKSADIKGMKFYLDTWPISLTKAFDTQLNETLVMNAVGIIQDGNTIRCRRLGPNQQEHTIVVD